MEQKPSSSKGFLVGAAETIGSAVGKLATVGKSVTGTAAKAEAGAAPAKKTRLPRKLKKAQKKAAALAQH